MKAWSDYKAVSHLWAARNFWVYDLKCDDAYAPDTPQGIIGFLSIAETFRKAAENPRSDTRRGQSPVPVLRGNESWTVPENLSLPIFDMPTSKPLPESSRKTLDEYHARHGN